MSNSQWWPILCLLFYNRGGFTVKLKPKTIHFKKIKKSITVGNMEYGGLVQKLLHNGKTEGFFHFCDKCLMFSSRWRSHFP